MQYFQLKLTPVMGLKLSLKQMIGTDVFFSSFTMMFRVCLKVKDNPVYDNFKNTGKSDYIQRASLLLKGAVYARVNCNKFIG